MRFLKRLTVRLRWPAVVLVGLVVGACIASCFIGCYGVVHGPDHGLSYEIGRIRCFLSYRYLPLSSSDTAELESSRDPVQRESSSDQDELYPLAELRPLDELRQLGFPASDGLLPGGLFHGEYGDPFGGPSGYFADLEVPLWYLALPPALLAIAGFRLKRREPKPGQCQHCRHPLAGAAVCPECGTPALASP